VGRRHDPAFNKVRIAGLKGFVLLSLSGILLSSCGKKEPSSTQGNAQATPTPIPVLPRKNYDLSRLYSGLALTSSVECAQGTRTALATIPETNAYELEITLRVRWPAAATNSAELSAATPDLPGLLPDLDQLLAGISPSADYATLLSNKEKSLRNHLSSLQKLPYRDSLFDCQTILDLKNPATGRKALLVQAIMNVNTDGSDGDRNLTVDRLSSTFQPQTNYRWPKSGSHTNPCLAPTAGHLSEVTSELASGTLTPAAKNSLQGERDSLLATLEELKRWDFLVGGADPFIVLPSFMVGKHPGQPSIGDYAVVIVGGKLYPAILGDMGPGSKIGESSLRICREIDARSGADRRPVNRPDAVYLVFPGTAEKPFRAPDYGHWDERCKALWREFGGSENVTWHEWTSLEKPWPTPTPFQGSPDSFLPQTSPSPSGTNPAFPTESSPSPLPSPQNPSPETAPPASALPSTGTNG
jgi:hypothetical protein